MMNPFMGLGNLDPSKMDPKVLAELTQIVRQLPPDKIARMQSIMHNMMAGFDVSKEMEEFERTLPPGFREKVLSIMPGAQPSKPARPEVIEVPKEMDEREARLTILRAVAEGQMSPDEAERLLFPSSSAG